MKQCSICGKPQKNLRRGWCQKHYWRWKRSGDPIYTKTRPKGIKGREHKEWFFNKLEQSGDCLLWPSYKNKSGHGIIREKRKTISAHRVAYELEYGAIPNGAHIIHDCHNPSCCNPRHLRASDNKENMLQKTLYGRRSGKSGGMKLYPDEVIKIRKLLKQGITQAAIGAMFGVSRGAISGIASNRRWKHIT